MLKKIFVLLLVAGLCLVLFTACVDEQLKLDNNVYTVAIGEMVVYDVSNADASMCTITIEDESILSLDGTQITAIKAGITTFTISYNNMKTTAVVVVESANLVAPTLTVENGIVSWERVENAQGYVIKINDTVIMQNNTSYDLNSFNVGQYKVFVASTSSENYETSEFTSIDVNVGFNFDKASYEINCGDELGYSITNLKDLTSCELIVADDSILNVDGLVVSAIKVGTTTLTIKYNGFTANASVAVTAKMLDVPALENNNGIVSWSNVLNADKYIVTINTTNTFTTTNTSIDLSVYSAGTYSISVLATASSENYLDSQEGTLDVLVGISLDKETYTVTFGDNILFNVFNVENIGQCTITVSDATVVSVNGSTLKAINVGYTKFTVSYNGYNATATILVKAKALAMSTLTVENGIVSWENVENAESYIVKINNKTIMQTENSIDLNENVSGAYNVSVTATSTDINFAKSNIATTTVTIGILLDSDNYTVTFGDNLIYNILKANDLTACEIAVADSTILSVNGLIVKAVKVGTTTITVKYNNFTATASVEVRAKMLDAPTLENNNGIVSWSNVLNSDKYIVTINSINTFTTINTSIDLSAYSAGTYSVSVVAISNSNNFVQSNASQTNVIIEVPYIKAIKMVTAPNKTIYNVGESISLEGLLVEATYSNGNIENVTNDVTISINTLKVGDTSFTICLNEMFITVNVEVKAKLTIVKSNDNIENLYYFVDGSVELTTPIINGFTFVGWYLENTYVTEFNGIMPNNNTTIYARWIQGNVIIVNNGDSIQDAIDNASEGSTILAKAGVYAEFIEINKAIILLGNNYGLSFDNNNRKPEAYIYPSTNDKFNTLRHTLINISVSNVTIDGFVINGDNPYLDNIWTSEKNNQTQAKIENTSITRNDAKNFYNSKVGLDLGTDCAVGITAYRSNVTDKSLMYIVIKNNIIKNFADSGIVMNNNNHAKALLSNEGSIIENNLITKILGFGLFLEDETYWGTAGTCVVADSYTVDIVGNTFTESSGGMQYTWMYYAGNTPQISDNTFINNSMGIWINSTGLSDFVLISGNVFTRTDEYENIVANGGLLTFCNYGILISGTDKGILLIKNNTIKNIETGIIVNNTKENTIYIESNTITNANEGIAINTAFLSYTNNKAAAYITVREDNRFSENNSNFYMDETEANCIKITFTAIDGSVKDIIAKGIITAPKLEFVKNPDRLRFKTVANAEKYFLYLNGIAVQEFEQDVVGTYIYYNLDLENDALEVYNYKLEAIAMYDIKSNQSNELSYVRITAIDVKYAATITAVEKTFYVATGTIITPSLTKSISSYVLDNRYYNAEDGDVLDINDTVEQSTTIYSVWLVTFIYTVKDGAVEIEKKTFTYGDEIIFYNVNKDGYEVEGYYTATNLKTKFNFDNIDYKNKTIYIKYIEIV